MRLRPYNNGRQRTDAGGTLSVSWAVRPEADVRLAPGDASLRRRSGLGAPIRPRAWRGGL